jgi:hypothetical protein
MSNSPEVQAAIKKTARDLLAMSHEEFNKLFEDHKNGQYDQILIDAQVCCVCGNRNLCNAGDDCKGFNLNG